VRDSGCDPPGLLDPGPPAIQAKLLRVLQEKTYYPLGAAKPQIVNVRVVTATNKNLAELVTQGQFRSDLYYRIKVLEVHLPPLRDRKDDLPLLCDHFLRKYNVKYKKSILNLSDEAFEILANHDFPGNVRELENLIEHAFTFCSGNTIEKEHFPAEIRGGSRCSTQTTETQRAGRRTAGTFALIADARSDW